MKDLGTELLHESTVGTCAFPGDNKANWPPVPKWLYKLDTRITGRHPPAPKMTALPKRVGTVKHTV